MRALLCGLLLVFASCGNASAWGDLGHKIVCEIAFKLAMPETRREIRRLIQQDDQFDFFTESCTFPDHPRKRAAEHFVNLPRNMPRLTTDSCPSAAKCALTAIPSDLAVLSSSANDEKKLEALKFLGHWVGDIHQPLHISFEDDRGGNQVTTEGECTPNMHGTWDTCLIVKSIGSNVKTVANEIIATITPAQREQWTQASNPRDWANESYAIARAPGTKYCVIQGALCNKPSGDVAIDANYVDTTERSSAFNLRRPVCGLPICSIRR